ncbi:Serine phosphatase RsbU regulator of sigma subunit [Streptomyces bottropensis ATCC 25435]|uniref:Serine phosphatase RsbU regulator of sigma subunit n=1 Tax=Streptomyces bottropensis ATCC 25435 TaxID=1054862 RepID=M3E4T8_9ACTN|nr:Serine phosphatase RsbU regulator of sigma subunit [Streptomyces bottropensis ATCC 25435]
MMILDITTGRLQWVNAGHPAPLLIRDRAVLDRLEGPTTLPVGFGGQEPVVSERMLQPGDRLLCFTDGLIEEHHTGGRQFGGSSPSSGPTGSSTTAPRYGRWYERSPTP